MLHPRYNTEVIESPAEQLCVCAVYQMGGGGLCRAYSVCQGQNVCKGLNVFFQSCFLKVAKDSSSKSHRLLPSFLTL